VRVTAIKDRLIELNEQITWAPENVKHGQFGKWLEGARDWSISRNRFWGSPIPVWKSDDPEYPRVDVYGSLADLERDFGRLPRNEAGEVDLHRPYIDELTRPNPDDPTGRARCGASRTSSTSGSTRDRCRTPRCTTRSRTGVVRRARAGRLHRRVHRADARLVLRHARPVGALFDRPAFTGVACHGIVLGSDGQKMSKSLRNYPDVSEVFDRDGSDAMRWFLMASSVLRGGNLVVTEEGSAPVCASSCCRCGTRGTSSRPTRTRPAPGATRRVAHRLDDVLDRYILALTGDLVRDVAADLEALDSTTAAARCATSPRR
jgi:isoleucyl-tRNA synthetase